MECLKRDTDCQQLVSNSAKKRFQDLLLYLEITSRTETFVLLTVEIGVIARIFFQIYFCDLLYDLYDTATLMDLLSTLDVVLLMLILD